MWLNPQFSADLVTFTEEIFNGKLHFLCSESACYSYVSAKHYLGTKRKLKVPKTIRRRPEHLLNVLHYWIFNVSIYCAKETSIKFFWFEKYVSFFQQLMQVYWFKVLRSGFVIELLYFHRAHYSQSFFQWLIVACLYH